jgi:hypothetical protein
MTGAVASTSLVNSSDIGLFGFSRKPIVATLGTNSCNSASPLPPNSPEYAFEAREVASRPTIVLAVGADPVPLGLVASLKVQILKASTDREIDAAFVNPSTNRCVARRY